MHWPQGDEQIATCGSCIFSSYSLFFPREIETLQSGQVFWLVPNFPAPSRASPGTVAARAGMQALFGVEHTAAGTAPSFHGIPF